MSGAGWLGGDGFTAEDRRTLIESSTLLKAHIKSYEEWKNDRNIECADIRKGVDASHRRIDKLETTVAVAKGFFQGGKLVWGIISTMIVAGISLILALIDRFWH